MNAVKNAVKQYLRRPGNEHLQAKVHATVGFLRAQPAPILVYQMGKVGSTSVCRSLEAAGHHPVHVHFLTAQSHRYVRAAYEDVGMKPAHYYTEKLVRPYLKWTNHRLKVISLVRDPVARYVSGLFQWPTCRDAVSEDAAKTRADVAERLSQPNALRYELTWFDRELKKTLGVDVLGEPFDREHGYQTYRGPRADVLLLKLERLSELLPTVVSDFVGTPLQNVRANVGKQKNRGALYAEVKRTLTLPRSVCERTYDHEWVRHFYTADEIASFVRKWSASSSEESHTGGRRALSGDARVSVDAG
jgi:hypothetical protein